MKAIGLTRYLPITDPDSLQDIELPQPSPAGHDLLVKVEAIAVNPVDAKIRAQDAPAEAVHRILGWDAAGTVTAVGPEVTLFKVGDAVYYAGSLIRPGTNSEFHLVDERIVGNKPRSLDFAQAAALPLTAITAWEALFERLGVSREGADAGKTILILGGAGGVGSIAIQLARQVGKLQVVATASRPESAAWCRDLGAAAVIDHFGDVVAQFQALGTQHADYVLCLNDTDKHFAAMSELVAPQGMVCSIVPNAQPLPVERLMRKSAGFVWELMFTRPIFDTPDLIEQHRLLDAVAQLVDAGVIRGTLGEVFGTINAANLRRAHAALESGRTIGKIVLQGF